MEESLGDYARNLRAALDKKSGLTTYNRDAVHAAIVVYEAFRQAVKTVLLLSQKLDASIYSTPWLVESVERFLGRGGTLRILVEEAVDENHPLRVLAKSKPDVVRIAKVPTKMIKGYDYNFMLVDGRGYRFEHNREEYSATVSFDENEDSHKEMVGILRRIFEVLEDVAEPLP